MGLIGLYKTLPKDEGKSLMNDAEDRITDYTQTVAGQEYILSNRPKVSMKFRDFDKDGIDELADVRILSGFNRRYRYAVSIGMDLYDPPKTTRPLNDPRPILDFKDFKEPENPSKSGEMIHTRKTP